MDIELLQEFQRYCSEKRSFLDLKPHLMNFVEFDGRKKEYKLKNNIMLDKVDKTAIYSLLCLKIRIGGDNFESLKEVLEVGVTMLNYSYQNVMAAELKWIGYGLQHLIAKAEPFIVYTDCNPKHDMSY